MNFNEYLASLGSASNLENFEANLNSPDEYYEALEAENFLKSAKGYPGYKARAIASRIVKNPAAKAELKMQMRQSGVAAGFQNNPALPGIQGNLQAQINVQATVAVAGAFGSTAVPVPIFGAYDSASNYTDVLNPLIPSGTTLAITQSADGKSKIFTYTKGAGVSCTITVSLQEYPYNSFIEALKGSAFMLSQARYSVSDTSATGLAQMTQAMSYFSRSMFGKTVSDNVPLAASKSPYQQQTGVVDILGSYKVDASAGFTLLVNPNNGQVITLGSFITGAEKAAM
jgi:hypothetical protein